MSNSRPAPHLRQFAPVKYKKAPQAPRRFKSSYMFFSTKKHKEIRAELAEKGEGNKLSTTEVAKMVSQAWKALPDEEREKWEVMARQDKARYEMEKSMYTGPWKVPATKRVSKDPKAPKRPMSAFLSFSNSKRADVKSEHQGAKNAEISRILAQMWKEADPDEKKKFIDEEFALRQRYKIAMSEWKRQSEEEIEMKRKEREDEAMRAVREGKLPVRKEDTKGVGTDSNADKTSSTGLTYNTKIANDVFGQSSFPSPPQISNTNRSQQNVGYNGDYSQQSHQHHYPHMPSSYYNSDPQTSPDTYDNNNTGYRNPYAAYQPPENNSSGYEGYPGRYDGGMPMGYESFGQHHPYGYAPQSYYRQDYHQAGYAPGQSNAGNPQHHPYSNYDPNNLSFDQQQHQPPHNSQS